MKLLLCLVVLLVFLRPSWRGSFVAHELRILGPRRPRHRLVLRAEGDVFNKQKFLRRSEFDFLSLQDFRREALIQYSNTNQSEPLRILIFFFLTICGFSAPGFAPSNAPPWYFAVALLAVGVFGFLFLRERGKRTAQLVRLEREYAIGDLPVELTDPASGSTKSMELQGLRSQLRIVAIYGTFQQVKESLRSALPYRRRFEQSDVLLLPLCSSLEGSDEAAYAAWGEQTLRASRGWLGKPQALRRWRTYFQGLLEDKESSGQSLWVGLNFRGRVFGSDFGCPIWDELLAAMPPTKPLSSTEPCFALANESCGALEAQRRFYDALGSGNVNEMQSIFEARDDADLSAALQVDEENSASNLSDWNIVLAPENRPQLRIASNDCVLLSERSAITSCIEFPVLGPTLLATQLWERDGPQGEWRLLSHRSIPYATQVEARVALRCDHRGCIAFGKQLDAMR